MIEYNGQVSDNCKNYMKKKEQINNIIMGAFVAIMFSVIILFIGIYIELLALLFLVIPFVFFLMCCIPQKGINRRVPYNILIDEGELLLSTETFSQSKSVFSVKKIVDMGEWYQIYFYFPYRAPYFACQKDLLVEGTIEEFEILFEGKIVRKN